VRVTVDTVERYLDELRGPPDPVLAEMEAHGARDGVPIVEVPTGEFLRVLAAAAGARRVVEIGTAIGVSTLHLARGVGEDGLVVSFEVDPERHAAASRYLERAGVGERVDLRLEDARTGLRALEGRFDLAFLDGVKAQYPEYLEGSLRLLRRGGTIAVDNVLLSGAAASGRGDGHWSQEHVDGMRAFTRALLERPDVEGTVVPVGDGVLVAVVR
jgi:predicted O-methyltransferase YrrM